MNTPVGRLNPLPLRDVFAISLKEIRNRFGRSLISMSSVFLGITFLTATVSASLVNERVKQEEAARTGQVISEAESAEESQRRIWLVTIALLLSTIGIMNTMLMSVTERFREIGTMKCMGALNRCIAQIFLFESVLLGAIGSAAGVGTGAVLALVGLFAKHGVGATFAYLPLAALLTWCGLALGLGLFLSVLGSILPTYRAVTMVPADAMRTEV